MRNRLSWLVAIASLVMATGSLRAQRPADNTASETKADGKPCVVVFGAVRKPARFEIPHPIRLAEALALAGGPSEAAASTLQVIPSGRTCYEAGPDKAVTSPPSVPGEVYSLDALVRGDEKANPLVNPGDLILVAELPVIYVVGNVVNPRGIHFKQPLTLLEAIRMAGGLGTLDRSDKVRIIRGVPPGSANRILILVSLKAIRNHHSVDLVLEPYDIIDVLLKHGHYSGDSFGRSEQVP